MSYLGPGRLRPDFTASQPVLQENQFHAVPGHHHSGYTTAPSRHDMRAAAGRPNDIHEAISAWFLGPQAENYDILLDLFKAAADGQRAARLAYHPEDGEFITDRLQASSTFKLNVAKMKQTFMEVIAMLNAYSVPFFSPRYAGHMCFETSMPAIAGMLATMLFNPNNVAFEASPWTTQIELLVGRDMCEMLGLKVEPGHSNVPVGWGHIACDGTVANLESIWAARNLKFYPLSLRDAMEAGEPLHFVSNAFRVRPCAFDPARPATEWPLFSELEVWDLLNLRVEDILNIPELLQAQFGISPTWLDDVLKPFLIQTCGKDNLERKWGIETPQYLISNTKHYSWPKGAAIAGIGSKNMVDVQVDNKGHVDIPKLRVALSERLARKQAVYAVVAIIGSTEEGAVDPLDEIVKLRTEFQAEGMSFVLHADAAWGGYFASMIREPRVHGGIRIPKDKDREFVPELTLSEYTINQFHALKHADSITIDPHKAGYIPYPAGGLCYRDGRMRYLLTWSAPYLKQGSGGESIGIYGVEGSKPGAPAVACYMHHTVIPLDKYGHGGLLGEAAFTAGRFAAHWAAMTTDDQPYLVVPFNALQSEAQGEQAVKKEKAFIRAYILGKANEEIFDNQDAMKELRMIGSDLNINSFSCNFRVNGIINDDVEEANHLNDLIFEELSVTDPLDPVANTEMFLSCTTFALADYGECAKNFKRRLGLEDQSSQGLRVLRNVVMSPFQTAGDFVQKIADIFERSLTKHTKTLVWRNTISPQKHVFTVQGTDQLYLCYQPQFHLANARFQLVLTATATDWAVYIGRKLPEEVYTLTTEDDTTLDDIIHKGAFSGIIQPLNPAAAAAPQALKLRVQVSNVAVVKKRPLNAKWRDAAYPRDSTPFYLYGTPAGAHVDHMLLCAPNSQLSAENVTLELDRALPAAQLAAGVLAFVDVPEAAMQPLTGGFFAPRARFRVTVYEDPRAAETHGPGLAAINAGQAPLATGTLALGDAVYVDTERINEDVGLPTAPRRVPARSGQGSVHKMSKHLEGIRMKDVTEQ